MTLNKKLVNYKVVDHIEYYKFCADNATSKVVRKFSQSKSLKRFLGTTNKFQIKKLSSTKF
jgi:hypothetical protein